MGFHKALQKSVNENIDIPNHERLKRININVTLLITANAWQVVGSEEFNATSTFVLPSLPFLSNILPLGSHNSERDVLQMLDVQENNVYKMEGQHVTVRANE